MDREERLRRIMEQTNSAKSQLARVARKGKPQAEREAIEAPPTNPDVATPTPVAALDADEQQTVRQEALAAREESDRREALLRQEQMAHQEAIRQEEAVRQAREKEENEKAEAVRLQALREQEEMEQQARRIEEKRLADEVRAQQETEAEKQRQEARRIEQEERLRRQQEDLARQQDRLRQEKARKEQDRLAAAAGQKQEQGAGGGFAPSEPVLQSHPTPIEAGAEHDNIVDDIQEDVLPIVLEEAQEELIPEIQELLERLFRKDHAALPDLHRKVHTLKGSLAMVGAMRGRALMHSMETWMEKAEAGEIDVDAGHERLAELFENVKERVAALARGDHRLAPTKKAAMGPGEKEPAAAAPPAIQTPKRVHLRSDDVDRYITEINEARLANASLAGAGARARQILSDLEEKGLRLVRVLRELEIHAESQIQSRKTQVEEAGEEFDPLEFDRYTHLQEIVRFLSEGVNDVMDLQRDMVHQAAEQETVTAYQGRAIESVQEGLQRTRLIPADALADRLHKVVWATSRELGKPSEFYLDGGRQALDRMLLERIASPLEHILRNSIAHGIESQEDRRLAGKPSVGMITMQIRQEAGRVHMVVSDDGRGLDPEKIKQKAVSKGLWPAHRPMSMSEAADMICSAGFSTADAVSEIAGRGVGMDVVRSEVMAMGGRFDIQSTTGQGMTIAIVLPTAIASISVVLVGAGGETWAVPVEMVEHMDRITPEKAQKSIGHDGKLSWNIGQERFSMRYRRLGELMGVSQPEATPEGALLILRTGDQRAAVFVDGLLGVAELPMRSLGKQWSSVPGVMGATILPDGRAGFLVDPLRADWSVQAGEDLVQHKRDKPLVMVVDDSITVRKVTARFLERHGYDAILAKDGQEAVEMLVDITPDVILLDVEMPRMDGFDCARHIRENPKVSHVPIVMITSRTADKHRQRALAMGVNAYLGKPYKEEELLPLLVEFSSTPQPSLPAGHLEV